MSADPRLITALAEGDLTPNEGRWLMGLPPAAQDAYLAPLARQHSEREAYGALLRRMWNAPHSGSTRRVWPWTFWLERLRGRR